MSKLRAKQAAVTGNRHPTKFRFEQFGKLRLKVMKIFRGNHNRSCAISPEFDTCCGRIYFTSCHSDTAKETCASPEHHHHGECDYRTQSYSLSNFLSFVGQDAIPELRNSSLNELFSRIKALRHLMIFIERHLKSLMWVNEMSCSRFFVNTIANSKKN
jgi:hypothetical protein